LGSEARRKDEVFYELRLHSRRSVRLGRNKKGFEGMRRWIGLGVIADNIIQIGRCLALQRA
jgi:hypothetical protein